MKSALNIVQKFFPKVGAVKDATRNTVIEVTKRDEAASRRKDHNQCAMAMACQRAMHLDGVIIARTIAYLVKDRVATRYCLPESVTREVVSFDRGGGFAPGEYKLLKPNISHRLDSAGGHNRQKKNTAKRPEPKHMTSGIRTVLGSKVA